MADLVGKGHDGSPCRGTAGARLHAEGLTEAELRRAKAKLAQGSPGAAHYAYHELCEAMQQFEKQP